MIKRKDFDAGIFDKRRFTSRASHPISMLLKKNVGYAMKAEEISKKTKMNENTVRSMLLSLEKDGLVMHKAPYFAWKKK